ncbi:hypothetical protein NKJ52_20695 [Mesorhizobium australicum]|uniref:hypothetical protein n=1 Tax=Mesorhizobium australicum TaxID=536018 RepID=UPI003337BD3B
MVGLAGKQFLAGSGNIVALNCGEPDQSAFPSAGDCADPADDSDSRLGRIVASSKAHLERRPDRGLLIGDNPRHQLRRMILQPLLCREIAGIPADHDAMTGWIAERWHALDSIDPTTVESRPNRLIKRPESGRVQVHGVDRAVDVASLQPLHDSTQHDVAGDIVDRLDEGCADGRLELRDEDLEALARRETDEHFVVAFLF